MSYIETDNINNNYIILDKQIEITDARYKRTLVISYHGYKNDYEKQYPYCLSHFRRRNFCMLLSSLF